MRKKTWNFRKSCMIARFFNLQHLQKSWVRCSRFHYPSHLAQNVQEIIVMRVCTKAHKSCHLAQDVQDCIFLFNALVTKVKDLVHLEQDFQHLSWYLVLVTQVKDLAHLLYKMFKNLLSCVLAQITQANILHKTRKILKSCNLHKLRKLIILYTTCARC
jgi:hypothetical protein